MSEELGGLLGTEEEPLPSVSLRACSLTVAVYAHMWSVCSFYFVSNPVLLLMLSQGSDPLAVQAYYEKIFDSITMVCVLFERPPVCLRSAFEFMRFRLRPFAG